MDACAGNVTDVCKIGQELLMSVRYFSQCQSISIKWEKPLGQTTGWLRAKLSFAILRATNLCLRGSRTKWRSGVGMDDGAGLPAELPKLD